MYSTPAYIKKYFMYDNNTKVTYEFNSKEELVNYLAIRTKSIWNVNTEKKLEDLIKNQNLTGKDLTKEHNYKYKRLGDTWSYNHIVTITSKAYIFYYMSLDGTYHIFSINDWIDDIKALYNTIPLWPKRKNWCSRCKFHPYQHKSRYYYSRKSNLDYIEDEYLPYLSHKARFYDFDYHYSRFASRSERCWKKQTKKKHQYGNDSRDKYLESDFFTDIEDDII